MKNSIGHGKLNKRNGKWSVFLETFPYVIQYKKGKENVVADALSRKHVLINTLSSKLMGFECLKALDLEDPMFAQIFKDCEEWEREMWMRDRSSTPYSKFDGFLFKGKRPCVPVSSWRELFMREAHNGGLMGHFGIEKTRGILEEQFYWPKIHKDVVRICGQCVECRRAKSRLLPRGLYTPLPTLKDFGLIS